MSDRHVNSPVVAVPSIPPGGEGVSVAMVVLRDGRPRVLINLHTADGNTLSVALDEHRFDTFAGLLAEVIEQLNAAALQNTGTLQ